MKMLLTEKTKQEKIIDEIQNKRNLFGLGLTSLIAACGATDNTDKDKDNTPEVGIGERPTTDLQPAILAEEVDSDTLRKEHIEYTPDDKDGLGGQRSMNVKDIQVTVMEADRGKVTGGELVFRIANGNHITNDNAASINKFGGDKYNLIFASKYFGDVAGTDAGKTGAVYIFWDIGSAPDGTLTAATTFSLKHLRVGGRVSVVDGAPDNDEIPSATPTFYNDLGGDADQADMLLKSSKNINIIWDVTKHATTDVEGGTELILGESPRILQVQGDPYDIRFIKINNNNNYDMTMQVSTAGSTNSYIAWDINNYYDADATDATPAINLTTATNATHGLLKITGGALNFIAPQHLTDINGGGINDVFLLDGDSNICIMFGEKVANRDKYGKALSYSVDFDKIDTDNEFYDKDGVAVDEPTGGAAKAGFFHYDLDGNGVIDDVEKNVGYRFDGFDETTLGNPTKIKTAYEAVINPADEGAGALSEEVYWDIA